MKSDDILGFQPKGGSKMQSKTMHPHEIMKHDFSFSIMPHFNINDRSYLHIKMQPGYVCILIFK